MLRYHYKHSKLLFVGINPHHGSFRRGVPFSNRKLFWYLLSRAGVITEPESELRDDAALKRLYGRLERTYGIGFVNVIDRPSNNATELKPGEEYSGQKRLHMIIRRYRPAVVCFVGKVAYQKFSGSKRVTFGWQNDIEDSKIFVMHFPLRGKASVRIREMKVVARIAKCPGTS